MHSIMSTRKSSPEPVRNPRDARRIGWALPPGATLFHSPAHCRDPALAIVGRPILPLPLRPFLKVKPVASRLFSHAQRSWALPGGDAALLWWPNAEGCTSVRTFTSSSRGSPRSGNWRSHRPHKAKKSSAPAASAATVTLCRPLPFPHQTHPPRPTLPCVQQPLVLPRIWLPCPPAHSRT